jgi:GNAT superfamily N-acetyltransferase
MNETTVQLSALEQERFGIKTARAVLAAPEDIADVLAFCSTHDVALLIARCAAEALSTVQQMEQQGFLLMDTLLYYARPLGTVPLPQLEDSGPACIRPLRPDDPADMQQVRQAATEAFRGYDGHYHADSRLLPAHCDEVYVSWAVRACQDAAVADAVLLAERDGQVVGFGVLQRADAESGDGRLYGILPAARGRGIYRALMLHSLHWCQAQGFRRMLYSTQLTNIAAQKVCVRLGFELSHAYYTFHRWFDVAGQPAAREAETR